MQATIVLLLACVFVVTPASAEGDKQILFYYGQGCSHCAKVESFFDANDYYQQYPIESKEIYFDADNRQEFIEKMSLLGVDVNGVGVPTVIFGDRYLTGDTPIIEGFVDAADNYLSASSESDNELSSEPVATNSTKLSLWMVVSAAAVDAINPCAFAVLIILLTTVLAKKDRRKALLSGLCFSAAVFTSYVLMGLGVYAALGSTGTASTITNVVGIIAVVLGLLNLRNYFWYDSGGLIEVPKSWRPKMVKVVESVTSPSGAVLVGLVVSLFLLPCTSGPYIVILGLLADNSLDAGAISYLLLYNLIFVSPMVVITILVNRGLDPEKVEIMRQQNLERLHLIAGIILLAIGGFVLLT